MTFSCIALWRKHDSLQSERDHLRAEVQRLQRAADLYQACVKLNAEQRRNFQGEKTLLREMLEDQRRHVTTVPMRQTNVPLLK
jgi:hypothetical protein